MQVHYTIQTQSPLYGRPSFTSAMSTSLSMLLTATARPIPPHDVPACNVRAGLLGDSWLPNALEILSAQPTLVRRMFVVTGQENVGRYCVKIYQNGEWKLVYVDSNIPCQRTGEPAFTRGDPTGMWIDSFTWPSLVEKAFAKLYGSYHALESPVRNVANALEDMTGGVSRRFRCMKSRAWQKANQSRTMAKDAGNLQLFARRGKEGCRWRDARHRSRISDDGLAAHHRATSICERRHCYWTGLQYSGRPCCRGLKGSRSACVFQTPPSFTIRLARCGKTMQRRGDFLKL